MTKRHKLRVVPRRDGSYAVLRGAKGVPLEEFIRPERLDNPLGMVPFVYAFGILCGVGLSIHELGGNYFVGDFDTVDVRDHAGAIIFLPPEEIVGNAVNWWTGKGGFSHVVVYPAITDPDGEPLVIESREGRGVALTPLAKYDERPLAWVPLSPQETLHSRGAALALLGRPYRLRRGGMHCADLAYACMPRELQRQVRESGEKMTPNGLAHALGLDSSLAKAIPAPTRLANRLRLQAARREPTP